MINCCGCVFRLLLRHLRFVELESGRRDRVRSSKNEKLTQITGQISTLIWYLGYIVRLLASEPTNTLKKPWDQTTSDTTISLKWRTEATMMMTHAKIRPDLLPFNNLWHCHNLPLISSLFQSDSVVLSLYLKLLLLITLAEFYLAEKSVHVEERVRQIENGHDERVTSPGSKPLELITPFVSYSLFSRDLCSPCVDAWNMGVIPIMSSHVESC